MPFFDLTDMAVTENKRLVLYHCLLWEIFENIAIVIHSNEDYRECKSVTSNKLQSNIFMRMFSRFVSEN